MQTIHRAEKMQTIHRAEIFQSIQSVEISNEHGKSNFFKNRIASHLMQLNCCLHSTELAHFEAHFKER